MKIIKKYIKTYVFWVLSYIIPKQKGYLVFKPGGNGKEFKGNIKALILYIRNNELNFNYSFISFNDEIIKRLKKEGIKVNKNYLEALWALLRAEHIVLDAGFDYKKGCVSLVQLWHGIGFKNIGLFSKGEKEQESIYKKYDLIISTSEIDKEKKSESFGVNTCVVTGYPRNDIFFQNYKVKSPFNNYEKVILYAPTFRDFKTSPPFTESFWKQIDDYLKNNNALFLVKKHPNERFLTIPDQFSNVKDISKEGHDMQKLLLISDILVTDYSSVSTDFCLTNKPIIIYAYDLNEYAKKCRTLYYDLEKILPKPFVREEEELLEKIKDNSWQENPKIKKSYQKFKNTFHHYSDGNSSKRVVNEILKINQGN